MIFQQSCNNSTLVNLCPCDDAVIHDFVSMYILLDLYVVYIHNLQVSSVAFSTTPPVLHFYNIIWICPSKICFPYWTTTLNHLTFDCSDLPDSDHSSNTPANFTLVLEFQKRGSLHIHSILWSNEQPKTNDTGNLKK